MQLLLKYCSIRVMFFFLTNRHASKIVFSPVNRSGDQNNKVVLMLRDT